MQKHAVANARWKRVSPQTYHAKTTYFFLTRKKPRRVRRKPWGVPWQVRWNLTKRRTWWWMISSYCMKLIRSVKKVAELPRPFFACVYQIAVQFWRTYLGWPAQVKHLRSTTEFGRAVSKCVNCTASFFKIFPDTNVQFTSKAKCRTVIACWNGVTFRYTSCITGITFWCW